MKYNVVSNENRDIFSQFNVIIFEICGVCMKFFVFFVFNILVCFDEGMCCEFFMVFYVRQDVVSYGFFEIVVYVFCL